MSRGEATAPVIERMTAPQGAVPATPVEGAAARFRRGLGAGFVIHVVLTVGAAVVATQLASGFEAAFGGHAFAGEAFADGGPIAVETLRAWGARELAPLLVVMGSALLAGGLLALPAQLVWLELMRAPGPVGARVRRGLGHVPRGIGVSLLLAIPGLLALGVLVGAPLVWALVFADDPNPRLRDVGMLALLAPGLLTLAGWAAWHDLSRAAVAHGEGPIEAAKIGWRASRGGVAAYLGWWLVGAALTALGAVLGGPGVLAFLGLQVLALGRTLVRGRWLAGALRRAELAGADGKNV
ncbi:MAG TPA: hypothetical protein RMH85_13660 [Polyangiaceae bacterium LLY-WYZ-15_(1-7)]|nr:hypothetical protein [Sandaracinus sp.]HJL01922.1 hypothetical protein [Polyangiaceae bacterium LLY-WYZ-15_(1-7)]MBJ70772.1 hypothetical protein [Sandaracinus sp.]HJL09545.1 hypothetical protein [Polyangiaceae bacterium LLY-WYZ-15_(1-7)]HJL26542.1 hypothetical protein [Polyangiaceae bacterium LLY-WYZ-15_(1-7)]